jgi:hypothetical protein
VRRLREIDDKRCNGSRKFSSNRNERAKLFRFLVELETRLAIEGDVIVADRLPREWILWATAKTEALTKSLWGGYSKDVRDDLQSHTVVVSEWLRQIQIRQFAALAQMVRHSE